MNRKERRAAESGSGRDVAEFLKIADRFIDLANRENCTVPATRLHMAFLFASARYSAHVGKSVMEIETHEPFVEMMVAEYRDMLRQHLADQNVTKARP